MELKTQLRTHKTPLPPVFLILLILLNGSASVRAQGETVEAVLRNRTDLSNFVASLGSNSPQLLARLGNASVQSTVFAPLNQGKPFNLSAPLLAYHVADQRYLFPTNLTDGALVPSLLQLQSLNNGFQQLKVAVTNSMVSIDGVTVKQVNITASNGVIHVLGAVLPLPIPLSQVLSGDQFSTLKSLFGLVNLTLSAASTLFAPTDAAFRALRASQPALYGYLTSGDNSTFNDLTNVLQYHTLREVLYAGDIPPGSKQYITFDNQSVTITKEVVNNSASVKLNSSSTSANVTGVNTLASDGVLHTIDSLLVPNNFDFTFQKIFLGLNNTLFLTLLSEANLTKYLQEDCTFFAPTRTAWENAEASDYSSSPLRLVNVLSSFIYVGPPPSLTPNTNLTMLSNKTLHIGNDSTLTLLGEKGEARIVGSAIKASNQGRVVQINQVLGVNQRDPGFSKATIGWIIVGGMGGILLLAAIAVAVVWYIKRRRLGYETINGEA